VSLPHEMRAMPRLQRVLTRGRGDRAEALAPWARACGRIWRVRGRTVGADL